jgi:hypothetical protein
LYRNYRIVISPAPKKIDLVYGQLRQEILAGEWLVDCKLPTETEIAQRFDCSIGTVKWAGAHLTCCPECPISLLAWYWKHSFVVN